MLPSADDLRAAFDAATDFTVGLEEEVLVVDPRTFELSPRAHEVLSRLEGDSRFKPEMPAAQLEIVTRPHPTVASAIDELADGRRTLVEAARGEFAFLCAGVHPTAPAEVELVDADRYAAIEDTYGTVARRQMVTALQVHVAVPGAALALRTYNAVRAHLPELSALAANSPFYEGCDTGLMSVRPTLATQLPRQGLPPILNDWSELARGYAMLGDPANWWWEMRPHPTHGTLEIRVPDAQTTIAETARVAEACVQIVREMAEHPDPPVHDDWLISENRWSALRYGLAGEMHRLQPPPGRMATRERLEILGVRDVPEQSPAAAMRAVGIEHAAEWLAGRFAEGL